jgi:hypothetical protein
MELQTSNILPLTPRQGPFTDASFCGAQGLAELVSILNKAMPVLLRKKEPQSTTNGRCGRHAGLSGRTAAASASASDSGDRRCRFVPLDHPAEKRSRKRKKAQEELLLAKEAEQANQVKSLFLRVCPTKSVRRSTR